MPSTICQVKDGSGSFVPTTTGVDVTPANTVTIRLASQAGVDVWTPECLTTDDPNQSDVEAINASLVIDSVQKTATFTAPAAGHAYRFQSRIIGNDGKTYASTFAIYTLTTDGWRVHALDETHESGPGGWAADINGIIRTGGGGGGGGDVPVAEDIQKNAGVVNRVIGIRGRPITSATPLNGQSAAIWDAANNTHRPGWPAMPGERGNAISSGAVTYTTPAAARVGTGSGDAVQALLDAMGDLGDTSRGARVYLPEGCIRIEKNLHCKRSGHIQGFGTGGRFAKTVLVFDDGCNITFESQADSSDGGRCDRVRVEAVAFYGPGASGGTRTTKITAGVVIRTSAYFEQCAFIGFHGRGCEVDGSIGAGYFANYGEFTDCWFEDNTRDGFYIHGGNANSWQLNTPVSVTNGRPQAAVKAFQVSAAGPTYVDVTTQFNDATTANLSPFPSSEAVGDYFLIGNDVPFSKLTFDLSSGSSVPGVGGAVAWEYWAKAPISAWVALPTINDLTAAVSGSTGATVQPTAAFSNTIPSRADKRLYFEEPQDWDTLSINGSAALYWIRARIITVYSTNPVLDRGFVHDGAGYFDSSFLGCTYINPQTEGNATAYKVTGPTNRACLIGPYAELDQGPCVLTQNTCVFGGALNGVGLGKQGQGCMVFTNSNTCTPIRVPNNTGVYPIWSTVGYNSTGNTAYAWGRTTDSYNHVMSYDGTTNGNAWQVRSLAANFVAYALTAEGNSTGPGWLQFPSGFLLPNARILTMVSAQPAGASSRTSTNWVQGDIAWFKDPTPTSPQQYRCYADGNPGSWQKIYAAKRGTFPLAMANANKTLTGSLAIANASDRIKATGTLTADRTIFFPVPATDDDGAEHTVFASVTGGNIICDLVGGTLTAQTIAAGKQAIIGYDTNGMYRVTPDL